ncbi:hypothetical protein EAF00_012042 [Botryotinia globosa]|nr:hypothetical protein EAF00_012042 [Botryotinia globosa]
MASSRLAVPATAASRLPPALSGLSSLGNPASPPPTPIIMIMGHDVTSLDSSSRFDWSALAKTQITNFIIDQKITKEQCSRNKKDQMDSARFDPLFTILDFDRFKDLRTEKGEAVRDIVEDKLRTRMWKSWEGNGKVDKVHQEAILSGRKMRWGQEDAPLEGVSRRTNQRVAVSGQDIDRVADAGRRESAPLNAPSIPPSGPSSQPAQPIQTPQPVQPIQTPQPVQPIQAPQPSQPIQVPQLARVPQPVQPIQAPQPVQPIQAPQPVQPNQGPSSSDPYAHLSRSEKIELKNSIVNEEIRRRKGKERERSYQTGRRNAFDGTAQNIEPHHGIHHATGYSSLLSGLRTPFPVTDSTFATGSQSQGQDQSSRSVTQVSGPITEAHSRQSQDQGHLSQVAPGDNSSGFKTTVLNTVSQLFGVATDAWRGDGNSGDIGEGEQRENDRERVSPTTSVHAPPQLSAPTTDQLGRQSSISQSFAPLSIHDGPVEGLIGSQQQQQGSCSAQIPPAIPSQIQIPQAAYMASLGNNHMNSGMDAFRNLQSQPQGFGNHQQQGFGDHQQQVSSNPLGSQPLNHDGADSFMAPGNHGSNTPLQNSNSHFAVPQQNGYYHLAPPQHYGTNTFASPQYNGNALPHHNGPNAAGPQHYNVSPAAFPHNFNAPTAPQHYNVSPAAVPHSFNAPAAPQHYNVNPAAVPHNFNAPTAPQHYNVNPAAVPHNFNAPAAPQHYNVNPAAVPHNFNAPTAPQHYNVSPAAVPHNFNAPAAPFLINSPANLNPTPPNFSSFIRSTEESYTQSLAQDKASLEAQKAALQAYHQGLKDKEKDRKFAFLENVCRNARLGETDI